MVRHVIAVLFSVISFLPPLQCSQLTPKPLPPILAHVMKTVPFSFIYNNQALGQILSGWKRIETKKPLPDDRVQTITTYTDPATGLEVTWEATEFAQLGAVEWMVRLRNKGAADTPIIEKLLALDQKIAVPRGTVVFHHVLGSAERTPSSGAAPGMTSDYQRIDQRLDLGADCHLAHYGMKQGKHVESDLPYFNAQWDGGGLIGGIGWTGQWALTARRQADGLAMTVGQEVTHFTLHPGESVRTPSVLLLEWKGKDWLQSQNLWRRLLVAYYLPRIGGEVMTPTVTHTPNFTLMFDGIAAKTGRNPLEVWPTLKTGSPLFNQGPSLNYVNEKNQLELLSQLPDLGLEGYWMDAGWFIGGWPSGAGNWDPDPKFPGGLRPVGDAAHARGLKFILWFEPQRVSPGTLIAKQHPEWVLHLPDNATSQGWGKDGQFNFGIPAAQQWITDMLSQRIEEWGIDTYRNDNNECPLPFWRAADASDRQGITENHDIEGFYAFWDGLRQKHPQLVIDNANWRITGPDLEVTKRSIGSLTRTELDGYEYFPEVDQAQTMELSLWVPLHSSLLNAVDSYRVRSVATTGVGIGLNLLSPYIPQGELRKAVAEIKRNRPYWLGDFYPLKGATLQDNEWCAWQFHRRDLNAGYALFFRRPKSMQSSITVNLRELDPGVKYDVVFAESYDVKNRRTMTGNDLTKLRVDLSRAPGSVLVRYRRTEGAPQ